MNRCFIPVESDCGLDYVHMYVYRERDEKSERVLYFICMTPSISLRCQHHHRHELHVQCTVKSLFNESQFNIKSLFKEQNLVTQIEFHIKKSRIKESKYTSHTRLWWRPFVKSRLYCTCVFNDNRGSLSRIFSSHTEFSSTQLRPSPLSTSPIDTHTHTHVHAHGLPRPADGGCQTVVCPSSKWTRSTPRRGEKWKLASRNQPKISPDTCFIINDNCSSVATEARRVDHLHRCCCGRK